MNEWLVGFFACAAIHYGIHWGFSRKERVFLVFALQCVGYSAFCLATVAYFRARTVPDTQLALDRLVSIGVLIHAVALQFYAYLCAHRGRLFRTPTTGVLIFLTLLNQWAPLRGTVIELQTLQMPGGAVFISPVRTPPGVSLAVLYCAVLLVHGYGFFVAHTLWKRARTSAILIALASAAVLAGAAIGFLVDFLKVHAPYVGAWPHVIFVLCGALCLAREYSSRGARMAVSERQFAAAFEHAPIGIALLAPDGRFLRVNRALCRILTWTADELATRRLVDVTAPEHGVDEFGVQRMLELPVCTVERRLLRRDGESVWALLAVSAVPDEQGRAVQIIAQLQDVTELRAHRERLAELVAIGTRELEAAKDEAERANRAKSQFLGHISHEIRDPLNAILAHTQSLGRDTALSDAQRRKIEIVRSSGKHLQALVNDVLELSKLEAGRVELIEHPFDPWAMLVEVEQMFAAEAGSKGIDLSIDGSPRLPRVLLADGARVKQILINLASNALKFTQRGSIRLSASTSPLDDGSLLVRIAVADTGIGIAAPDVAQMFQPFEQLEAGKQAGGAGLGLAISLGHARLMGGDLSVQSAPGVGSTFVLTFLAKRGPDTLLTADKAPVSAVTGRTRRKVLIVDDLALNREVLSELLSESGFETKMAEDGAGAISIHADWHPDLVLIDLRMAGMGGLEAIRRMRASGSNAAIGAVSASALEADERQALAFGANLFIRKPYDYEELLDSISRVLANMPAE